MRFQPVFTPSRVGYQRLFQWNLCILHHFLLKFLLDRLLCPCEPTYNLHTTYIKFQGRMQVVYSLINYQSFTYHGQAGKDEGDMNLMTYDKVPFIRYIKVLSSRTAVFHHYGTTLK